MRAMPRRRAGDRIVWPVPRAIGVCALLCMAFWIWVIWSIVNH